MDDFTHLLPFAIAFGVTLGMIWFLVPLARRIGLVDHPNARKHHEGRVPLVGGMAMFCAFAFAVLALGGQSLVPQRAMLAGALVLVIAGVLDDFRELSARSRLAAQLVSAGLMVLWGGVVLRVLGEVFLPGDVLGTSWFAVPVTIFAVVGGINALNWSDGLDGLAGGLALVALGPAAYLAWTGGAHELLPFVGITASCVLAFWLLNMRFPWQKRARVFMGDAGSMFVGFLICWFLADLSQAPRQAMTPVTALYLFAIPLMDTVFVMARRWRNGLSPMAADRMHLHHLLLDMGFSHAGTAWTILALAAAIAGAGLWGMFAGVPEYVMFYAFVALFVAFYACCSGLRRRVERGVAAGA